MSAEVTLSPSAAARVDIHEIEQFLYLEAHLADNHALDEWEALWTDDAIYWVPLGDASGADPSKTMSIIYDNRRRITSRLNQLRTGKRLAQSPPSRLARVVTNIRILDVSPPGSIDEVTAAATFVLVESRPRHREFWAGRVTYGLRRRDDAWALRYKRVDLVDSDSPLPNLAFLL